MNSGGSHGQTDVWQSFTAGASGLLTQLDLLVGSPTGANGASGTLSIYAGEGTGGTLLSTQAIVLNTFAGYQPFPLATPAAAVAGQKYTYRIQTPTLTVCCFVAFAFGNPYAGGRSGVDATWDYEFKTYVSPPTNVLTALASGSVGIGTAAPTQKLEVAGQVFSNAGGFRFPDNTVQATAATTTPATTVSNGLTKTGNNIALGGRLSQATTISQAGNTFSLMNSGLGVAALDQQQLVVDAGSGGAGVWQSVHGRGQRQPHPA